MLPKTTQSPSPGPQPYSITLYIRSMPTPCNRTLSIHLVQVARNVRELALVQLRLPEDGVGVVETVPNPALLLDVVQVDETSTVRITVRGSQDTPAAKLERLLVRQVVTVLGVQHTIGKRLTGSHAKQVARQPRAV